MKEWMTAWRCRYALRLPMCTINLRWSSLLKSEMIMIWQSIAEDEMWNRFFHDHLPFLIKGNPNEGTRDSSSFSFSFLPFSYNLLILFILAVEESMEYLCVFLKLRSRINENQEWHSRMTIYNMKMTTSGRQSIFSQDFFRWKIKSILKRKQKSCSKHQAIALYTTYTIHIPDPPHIFL